MEDMPADVAEQLGARMGETYSEDACNGEQIPEHIGLTLHRLCTIRDAGADNFMVGCNVARLGMYDEVWRFGAARLSAYREINVVMVLLTTREPLLRVIYMPCCFVEKTLADHGVMELRNTLDDLAPLIS